MKDTIIQSAKNTEILFKVFVNKFSKVPQNVLAKNPSRISSSFLNVNEKF